MLVLTRKNREKIILDNPERFGEEPIEIAVLKINGDQVAIGIKAPQKVAVHREEIYLRIQKERALKD